MTDYAANVCTHVETAPTQTDALHVRSVSFTMESALTNVLKEHIICKHKISRTAYNAHKTVRDASAQPNVCFAPLVTYSTLHAFRPVPMGSSQTMGHACNVNKIVSSVKIATLALRVSMVLCCFRTSASNTARSGIMNFRLSMIN